MARAIARLKGDVQFQDIGNRKFQDIGKGLCQDKGKTSW